MLPNGFTAFKSYISGIHQKLLSPLPIAISIATHNLSGATAYMVSRRLTDLAIGS